MRIIAIGIDLAKNILRVVSFVESRSFQHGATTTALPMAPKS